MEGREEGSRVTQVQVIGSRSKSRAEFGTQLSHDTCAKMISWEENGCPVFSNASPWKSLKVDDGERGGKRKSCRVSKVRENPPVEPEEWEEEREREREREREKNDQKLQSSHCRF